MDDQESARAVIADQRVLVDGAPALSPLRQVAPAQSVRVTAAPPVHVSRGGVKLDAAVDRFDVAVEGRRALDVGASTGGFTDCLLQRGAASVVALDVGRAQLHDRLRRHPRVTVHERTDIRHVDPDVIGAPFDLVVADLSFTAWRQVAEPVLEMAASTADLVVLVKPQFEAERHEATSGRGVITDPAIWLRTLEAAAGALKAAGAAIMEGMVSPLRGADGNTEFFLHLRPSASVGVAPAVDLDAVVPRQKTGAW